MFLSNIDKVLNFEVETVDFFVANSEFPPEAVVEKLRSALEDALTPYDFLAGRLCSDQKENGRLAIDCNAAGLELIAAASELNLKEIGDLEYPNPAFGQLVPRTGRPENEEIKRGVGEQPLIAFQVLHVQLMNELMHACMHVYIYIPSYKYTCNELSTFMQT